LKMRAPSLKEIIMSTEVGAGWIAEWQSKAAAEGMADGISKGMAQGIAQGKAEGEAEGKAEALAQVARNLKSSGMSNKLISQYTGLSLAKIKKLYDH